MVALLLVWDVYGWAPIPKICGTIAARIDLRHGRYKQLGYGLPVRWRSVYEESLRKQYGVDFEAVAGCTISPSQKAYVDGYNRVSERAVNNKYGHDVFKGVSDQAMNDWKRDHHSSW